MVDVSNIIRFCKKSSSNQVRTTLGLRSITMHHPAAHSTLQKRVIDIVIDTVVDAISIGQRKMTKKQSIGQNTHNQANDPQEKADHSQVAFPFLLMMQGFVEGFVYVLSC